MTLPSRGSAAMASSSEERGRGQPHGKINNTAAQFWKERNDTHQNRGSRVVWSCSVGDV